MIIILSQKTNLFIKIIVYTDDNKNTFITLFNINRSILLHIPAILILIKI